MNAVDVMAEKEKPMTVKELKDKLNGWADRWDNWVVEVNGELIDANDEGAIMTVYPFSERFVDDE